jgi:hypothetical protein
MACSSSLEDSSPSAMKVCLQLELSRQAYVAKTSDQFWHVSTRHAFKIWEDICPVHLFVISSTAEVSSRIQNRELRYS